MCVGAEFAVYDLTVSPARIKRDCGIGVISPKSFSKSLVRPFRTRGWAPAMRSNIAGVGLVTVGSAGQPPDPANPPCVTPRGAAVVSR